MSQGESGYDIDLSKFVSARMTRRTALKGAAVVAGLAALGPLASACGGTGTAASASSSPGVGKKGGILRMGMVGGGVDDFADTNTSNNLPNICISELMYEGIMQYRPDFTTELLLAEEVSSNADGTVWTVRLKPDILWQDGRPMIADDVVYTYRRIIDPKNPLPGGPLMGDLKPSDIKKVDKLTTTFTYPRTYVLFNDAMVDRHNHMVPVDFDPNKPVGSNSFKLTSLKPGEEMVFERFADFHGEAPILDGVHLIEFADPTARLNALLGGTVDCIVALPPSQIKSVGGAGFKTINAKSGSQLPFEIRIDVQPFKDVRVRQAFKSIVDRDQMLSTAYNGVGVIGNDMWSPYDPGYPKDIPQRVQDIEQAKSLLKQAGYDNNLTVELIASEAVGPQSVPQCQVFAQQASGAGVKVKVRKVDAGVMFGPQYNSWPFTNDSWLTRGYLANALVATMPTAPYNSTHWQNDQWQKLVTEAFHTVDDAKRNELIAEASRIEFEQSGYIMPIFYNTLDAHSDKVTGFVTNDVLGQPLGRYRFDKVYFV